MVNDILTKSKCSTTAVAKNVTVIAFIVVRHLYLYKTSAAQYMLKKHQEAEMI